ncbi:hypothetical protein [Halocella sp. SP3-1]|uniref:hypothetical protein n=1 Tax=Halocella sp. SP3-1 TaxID=2382161 RepID=UPI0013E07620|nr:hypothetical protein [Halocella sp. SP3-1]
MIEPRNQPRDGKWKDFVPFSHVDLIDRLKTTGFKIFNNNYNINNDFYYIVAEK